MAKETIPDLDFIDHEQTSFICIGQEKKKQDHRPFFAPKDLFQNPNESKIIKISNMPSLMCLISSNQTHLLFKRFKILFHWAINYNTRHTF
jgi:hypothetical protein